MPEALNLHVYPSPLTNESRMLRIARALDEQGFFSAIILAGQCAPGLADQQSVDGRIGIRRFGPEHRGGGSRIARLLGLAKWSVALIRHFWGAPLSCINCHSLATLPLGIVLKWRSGARLVYDTHELETEVAGAVGWRQGVARLAERVAMTQVDQVFCVSDAITGWYRSTYRRDDPLTVRNVPEVNVDTASAPDQAELRRQLAFPADDRIFLYQGLLSRGRGLERLIDAFLQWNRSDVSLVILGYGPLRHALIERAGGSPKIRVLEAVSPAELPRYSQAADVGLSLVEPISLSYEYCMPNKLFEYLVASLPVIVSPTREQAEFVTTHRTGVVAADFSPAAIRRAAEEVLAVPAAEWRARCAHAQLTVNWENEKQTMLRQYSGRLGFASSAG